MSSVMVEKKPNSSATMLSRALRRTHLALSAPRLQQVPLRHLRRQHDKTGVTRNEQAPPAPRSRTTGTQLPVLPLVAIFCFGSLSFYWMVKSRQGQGQSHYVLPERAPPKEQWPKSPNDGR